MGDSVDLEMNRCTQFAHSSRRSQVKPTRKYFEAVQFKSCIDPTPLVSLQSLCNMSPRHPSYNTTLSPRYQLIDPSTMWVSCSRSCALSSFARIGARSRTRLWGIQPSTSYKPNQHDDTVATPPLWPLRTRPYSYSYSPSQCPRSCTQPRSDPWEHQGYPRTF